MEFALRNGHWYATIVIAAEGRLAYSSARTTVREAWRKHGQGDPARPRGEAAALVLLWKILSVRYCEPLTVFPKVLETVTQLDLLDLEPGLIGIVPNIPSDHRTGNREGHVDRREKKRLRDYIGEHLDVSSTRLTDDEATFLSDFLDEYEEIYKGRTDTRTTSHDSWSSDGRYTRRETFTYTFIDDVGIREHCEYQDDDGQNGTSTKVIKDARGILNWLEDHPSWRPGFCQ
ncbi:hypothetical protein [Embleya sp. NPDC005971]|uniref:hypothetical protein n=1 Tax=Embleya sp. NPDC005971 TaxID=3156724 RepID=UPI0033F4090E